MALKSKYRTPRIPHFGGKWSMPPITPPAQSFNVGPGFNPPAAPAQGFANTEGLEGGGFQSGGALDDMHAIWHRATGGGIPTATQPYSAARDDRLDTLPPLPPEGATPYVESAYEDEPTPIQYQAPPSRGAHGSGYRDSGSRTYTLSVAQADLCKRLNLEPAEYVRQLRLKEHLEKTGQIPRYG